MIIIMMAIMMTVMMTMMTWPDYLQGLDAGEAPYLRSPGAGAEAWVNGVNVEAEVAGLVTHLGPDIVLLYRI